MDRNDRIFKEEVNSFVSSLQRLLPKKKDLILIEPARPRLTRLSNVHIEAKSVFPQCFVGAKLVILREILDKVKLVQNYNFGKSKESYRCFSHILDKELEAKNVDDALLIDTTGSATATYIEQLDGGIEMQLTSKIKDLVSSQTEISFEKENRKSIGSLTFSMKDVDPSTLKMVTQYVYSVVPEFSFGTEISFKPLSYPPKPDLSFSGRYERHSFALSSTVSRAGFQVCFYKQFATDVRIATVLNEGNRNTATSIALALHKTYQNGSELKVFVDSQKCGGFTFQRDVLFYEPHNEVRMLRLVFSTVIDRQRRVRLGFGCNLDF